MAETSKFSLQSTDAPIARYDSGRGIRCFSSRCGSPACFESLEHPEIIGVPLGVLDSGRIPPPSMHLWVSAKPPWCSIDDDLPQFRMGPG
jgi:hypothetical protein